MSEINCWGDEEHYGEVVPGYYLVRLVNVVAPDPDEVYLEDMWGLTYCNDPDFFFHLSPCREEDPAYEEVVEHYGDRLYGDIQPCYRLWKACLQGGYRPKKHGYRLAFWLVERTARYLEKVNWLPELVYLHSSHAPDVSFDDLVTRILQDVRGSSNPQDYTTHPDYRKIVEMGKAALPGILINMRKPGRRDSLGHLWGFALAEITGHIPQYKSKKSKDKVQYWLDFLRR
jgi:hypothetical protein